VRKCRPTQFLLSDSYSDTLSAGLCGSCHSDSLGQDDTVRDKTDERKQVG